MLNLWPGTQWTINMKSCRALCGWIRHCFGNISHIEHPTPCGSTLPPSVSTSSVQSTVRGSDVSTQGQCQPVQDQPSKANLQHEQGICSPYVSRLVWAGKARPWSEPCTLTGWWITFASWTWSLSLVQAAYSKNKTVPTNNPKLPSVTNKKQRNHRKSD